MRVFAVAQPLDEPSGVEFGIAEPVVAEFRG